MDNLIQRENEYLDQSCNILLDDKLYFEAKDLNISSRGFYGDSQYSLHWPGYWEIRFDTTASAGIIEYIKEHLRIANSSTLIKKQISIRIKKTDSFIYYTDTCILSEISGYDVLGMDMTITLAAQGISQVFTRKRDPLLRRYELCRNR